LQKDVISHLIENDDVWIDQQKIDVSDKGDHWILNYNQLKKLIIIDSCVE